MKKQLLLLIFCAGLTRLMIAQTNVPIINASFEYPSSPAKIQCNFNDIKGFGWRIDTCADAGREDSTKFGYDPANSVKVAFDGNNVGYSHNQDPHIYQIVDVVPAEGATYSLTTQAQASYPLSDTTDARIYFSVFSGTDTTKRTLVDSTSYMLNTATPLWELVSLNHTFQASSADAGKHLCIEFWNYYSTVTSGSWTYWDMFILKKSGAAAIRSGILAESALVFPNPSNGIFNVKANFNGKYNADVYDVLGKKLTSVELKPQDVLNLSGFSKGVYLLKLNSAEKSCLIKLIIK